MIILRSESTHYTIQDLTNDQILSFYDARPQNQSNRLTLKPALDNNS